MIKIKETIYRIKKDIMTNYMDLNVHLLLTFDLADDSSVRACSP